ncbi:SulP family inorganic anion transporter [Aetokthonos hydrillicola Thurmond2011]|jgi:MFS superfamily sulfate permease-like transporter|uniref:SulP family inorganic anion transporter n=1 Tax=Aetokthonos hydrillicola Thurmond2011 TaxID=2712845 RepID=A0AAP5I5C9_9CYAN|nr:SulP family inorganic anion transporter [Aetokthonos hydrillicola]MBO3459047.1 SulP family inorganic anion transporter [Aetokthonos hydrillicola CCALA 1050]MBW4584781.1 SulP family inorganic anion transporter [Aetokthonos hydrillicola CCALA 1050]MDR9895327.1 SulP family inorganic anion transporter [Aetokthonos hydrillicola Thurmond2011]
MTTKYLKAKNSITNDLVASLVVFLVALPLCLGIAIASGVPPALGLVTGMVGGIIVGVISGSPLQVSGPAAGLAVIVWELIQEHGIEMLGPIILLAGLIQLLAGVFKFGQLFRALSPAVIYGMLSGIGVMLIGSQFHVMLDEKPHSHGVENLISIPTSIYNLVFIHKGSHLMAGFVGVMTIITLLLWDKFKPTRLKLVPGALVGVLVATGISTLMKLPIQHVNVPESLAATIQLPTLESLINLFHGPKFLDAVVIAFIASAESLLSAAAVDRLHHGPRTDFDRELAAQGFGNMICGALGAMPMTGVIARSSVNVEAMAQTRLSTILHGVWLLALVAAAPSVLKLVPTSSLAAILLVTGYKLIKVENIRKLQQYGRIPVFIYFATLGGILATDLLIGVIIGFVLSTIKLIYKVSQLYIRIDSNQINRRVDVYLEGVATFIRLPKLAKALEGIAPGKEIYIHLEMLSYIDHSCLDFFSTWEKQQQKMGSNVIVQKDKLVERYRRPFTQKNSEETSS